MNPAVVITGAAGGFGLLLAEAFMSRGYLVIGLDRQPVKSASFLCLETNFSDLEAVRATAAEVAKRTDRIDVLVNSAVAYEFFRLGEYSERAFSSATTANFDAPLLLTSLLLKELERAPFPLVVNISSNAYRGSPFAAHYAMSKGAGVSLTRAINEEFRIHGKVRSSAVILGPMDTGRSNRVAVKGVTPTPGHTPVISAEKAAKLVAQIAGAEWAFYVPHIELSPRPEHIFVQKDEPSQLS